ncbi:MAG: peptidogalycan biosysnthesis protein, partial [Gammaproteobacteria bacterium]
MPISFEFASSISEVREYKNELKSTNPFEFLDYFYALEQSKSACKETGWTPKHIYSKEKNIINGFVPIYLKDNSYGEFVFDQQWAYALQRANRNYYPKLITATPFTPCITNKLFSNSNSLKNKLIDMTIDMMEQEN